MPAKTIQRLEEEIQLLKKAQDAAMSLAVYIGMTSAEAKLYDDRVKRISQLYDELIYLRNKGVR